MTLRIAFSDQFRVRRISTCLWPAVRVSENVQASEPRPTSRLPDTSGAPGSVPVNVARHVLEKSRDRGAAIRLPGVLCRYSPGASALAKVSPAECEPPPQDRQSGLTCPGRREGTCRAGSHHTSPAREAP